MSSDEAHDQRNTPEYQTMTCTPANIIALLAMPGVEDIEFEPARADQLHRPAD